MLLEKFNKQSNIRSNKNEMSEYANLERNFTGETISEIGVQ